MHVDVIERLRCPARHEESPLVATATLQRERRIVDGMLGCPVCGTEYAIRAGIADFRVNAAAAAAEWTPSPPSDAAVIRLAAQLDLTEAGRVLLLCGGYAELAPALSVAYDAICLGVGVALPSERHVAQHASVLRIDATVPLAPGSLHGAAIDPAQVARLGLDQVHGLVRFAGRLVAPATLPIPAGMNSLARDESEWVATRASDVLTLKRATR